MAINKFVAGGGAAASLAIGTLFGGVATGLVGAQTPPAQTSRAAQSTAQPADQPETGAEAPDAGGADAAVTAPPGSVSPDQAKQAATTYVAQTAPYNSEGLTAQSVTVNDENGTVLFAVDFTGANGAGVEVKVSTQGQVISADNGASDSGASDSGAADSGTQSGSQTDGGTPGQPEAPDAAGAAN